jgi:hypothetical protein
MSQARTTEILEKMLNGTQYLATVYDSDIDIAGPKQFSITTGTKKAILKIRIQGPAAATVSFNTGLVLGTGGSVSAGTAVTFVKRDQADTSTPLTVLKQDYVLGDTDQTAGTAIAATYHMPDIETVISFKLAASTVYGLVFTSIADNNSAAFIFELDEG